MKFYRCEHCGNIITLIQDAGVPVMCCGKRMTELVPGTVDASLEKHVPVVSQEGGAVVVKVGAAEHPMSQEHLIEWIVLESKQGYQLKHLSASDKPQATFLLAPGDEIAAVYGYCNLHGLWKI